MLNTKDGNVAELSLRQFGRQGLLASIELASHDSPQKEKNWRTTMSMIGRFGIGRRNATTWRNAAWLALLSLPIMGHAYAQQKTIAIIVPTLKITVLQTESKAAEAEA